MRQMLGLPLRRAIEVGVAKPQKLWRARLEQVSQLSVYIAVLRRKYLGRR